VFLDYYLVYVLAMPMCHGIDHFAPSLGLLVIHTPWNLGHFASQCWSKAQYKMIINKDDNLINGTCTVFFLLLVVQLMDSKLLSNVIKVHLFLIWHFHGFLWINTNSFVLFILWWLNYLCSMHKFRLVTFILKFTIHIVQYICVE